MEKKKPLLTLFGTNIYVGLDSLILLFLLFWWGTSSGMYVFGALLFGLLAILSILVHEFMHVFVARKFKIGCHGIRVMFMGMGAHLQHTGKTFVQTFFIAAVGPFTSLLIGFVLFFLYSFVVVSFGFAQVLVLLIYFNIVIGIFNFLPLFPLDGGRIFHAVLWGFTKDRHKGLVGAVYLSRALIVLGLAYLILSTTNIFSIVWLGIIGYFLWGAGTAELRQSAHQR